MSTTTRRPFAVGALVGLAVSWLPAFGQALRTARRVAFLSSGAPSAADEYLYGSFISAMTKLGWVDGTTLVVDRRYAENDLTRVEALTKELLALRPNIFVSSVDLYARAAAQATKTLPIVFVLGFDPVGLGLVRSLAQPGGNVTGFSVLNYELNLKRLALFKEALPGITTVGVLYKEADPRSQSALDLLRQAAQGVAIEVVAIPVRGRESLAPAISQVAQRGLRALMNVPYPIFFQERRLIAELCLQHNVAASFGAAEFADAGMLLGFGADFSAIYRQAGALVDRILRGDRPESIPVEQASSYELVVNLKTASALGISIPKSVLLQATRVVELIRECASQAMYLAAALDQPIDTV